MKSLVKSFGYATVFGIIMGSLIRSAMCFSLFLSSALLGELKAIAYCLAEAIKVGASKVVVAGKRLQGSSRIYCGC